MKKTTLMLLETIGAELSKCANQLGERQLR